MRLRFFLGSIKVLASIAIVLMATGVSSGQGETEHRLKAAFLLQFSKFVQWPSAAFDSPTSPIVIGLVGFDSAAPFQAVVDPSTRVDGRPVVFRRFAPSEVGDAHILFLSRDLGARANNILRAQKGKPVLIVGESPGLASRGASINFVLRDNKVRFEINPDTAKASQLNVSSRLLALAIIVK
jgi:hypothetical protein